MAQLGRFIKTCLDTSGNAQQGASVAIYREGATVSGGQSGTSPLTVTVYSPGKLAAGDSVFVGTTTTATYSINSKTATTVVLGGFSGTLNLSDGDRLVPSNAQPTLYGDDQGTNSTSNPLSSNSRGAVSCFMEAGGYDVLITKGTTKVLEYYLVTPTQAPAQVRWADEFAWSGSTSGGIQEALNDLPSTGGKVLLSNKTYSVSAKITVPSKVTLEGCGMGSTVLQLTADAILLENSDTSGGNSYITLRNLTCDGNNTVTTSNTNVLVNMKRVDQLRVEGCEFANCRADGLYIQAATAAKHVYVRGNYFHNTMTNVTTNAHAACYVATTSAAITQVDIGDNLFENIGTDNATTSLSQAAVVINGTNNGNTLVHDNIIYNTWCHGVHAAAAGKLSILDNYIEKAGQQNVANGGNGIFIDTVGTGRVVVSGNTIDTVAANSDNGIEFSGTDADCTITGNRIRSIANSNKFGIGLGGGNNVTISGNEISACAGVGIQNSTDGPTASTSMAVSGNVCNANGLGGINIRGRGRVAISGNDCSGSASGFGIQVGEGTSTSGAEATEISVCGNTCVANAGGSSGWGIRVIGELVGGGANLARRVAVCGNVLKGNTLDGLNLDSCSNVAVTGNVISTNTRDGVRFVVSGTDVVLDSNIISDNTGIGVNTNSLTITRLVLGSDNLVYNNTGGNASAAVGTPTLSGATPAVPGVKRAIVTNGGATNVTNLTGGVDGQVLQLQHTDGNTTYVDGTNIFLSGSANYNPGATSCLTLMSVAGKWYELGRSNN